MTRIRAYRKVLALMSAFAFLRKHSHSYWDQIGMTISSVCFVHCVVTPILVLSLPWLGQYFEDPLFHLFIFLLVVPIGVYAFWQGFKHHHNHWVLVLGVPGLLLVGLGALIPHEILDLTGHESITVVGSVFLISAHYLNRRTCRRHNH